MGIAPDTFGPKILDPDPNTMHLDPQQWYQQVVGCGWEFQFRFSKINSDPDPHYVL